VKYQQLFSLELQHAFYSDGRCRDFVIEATPETQNLLANLRCVQKSLPNGLRILIQVSNDNTPFIALPSTLLFNFRLRLQNPDFTLFTDLPIVPRQSDDEDSVPVFDLVTRKMITLENKKPATPGDKMSVTYPAYGGYLPSAFADITIPIISTEKVTLSETSNAFIIHFEAKKYRWAYYVVTDKANTPGIEDKASDKNKPVSFKSGKKFDQNNPADVDDKIAQLLLQQHPDMRTFKILSTDPIPCQQAVRKTLRMRINKNQDTLDQVLPSPTVQQSFIEKNEVSLYHVVKYFTQ